MSLTNLAAGNCHYNGRTSCSAYSGHCLKTQLTYFRSSLANSPGMVSGSIWRSLVARSYSENIARSSASCHCRSSRNTRHYSW